MADRFDMGCGVMHRAFEGEWVKHGDYQRETAQLQARVAELEGALAASRYQTLVECAEICRAVGSRETQFEAEDCADEIEELLSK